MVEELKKIYRIQVNSELFLTVRQRGDLEPVRRHHDRIREKVMPRGKLAKRIFKIF